MILMEVTTWTKILEEFLAMYIVSCQVSKWVRKQGVGAGNINFLSSFLNLINY